MERSFTRRADEPHAQPRLSPLIEGVRRVLRTELLKDTCSVAAVACLFAMHRRTLHRHLRTEGVAFRQVANEIGREVFGGGTRRRSSASSGGGLIGTVARSILGNLLRGR